MRYLRDWSWNNYVVSKEITVSHCDKLVTVNKEVSPSLSLLSRRIQSKFRDCGFRSIFQQAFWYELLSVNKVWNNWFKIKTQSNMFGVNSTRQKEN